MILKHTKSNIGNGSEGLAENDSFFHSRTFRKYLISYLIIFLLPLIVSTFIILNLFLVSSQIDAGIRHQSFVDNAADVIRQQLEVCDLNAKATTLTTMLSRYNAEQNPERTTVLINQSEKIASIADRVFYYIFEDEIVYSSERYDTAEAILGIYSDDFPDLLEDIATIREPKLYASRPMKISSKQYIDYLIYAVPIPWKSSYQDRAFIFFISQEKISELLKLAIPADEMKAFIFDGRQVIYASDDYVYDIDTDTIESIVNNDEVPEKILGKRSMIYKKQFYGEDSPLTLIMIADRSVVLEKQIWLQKTFFIIYLIIILLGFGIIMLFSIKNYNPIHKIAGSIKSLLSTKNEFGDDLSFISNTVDMVIEKKNEIESDIVETNKLYKQRLISRYFNRQFSLDTLDEELSKIGFPLKERYFQVVAINLQEAFYDAEKNIIEIMERDYDNGYNVLGASLSALDLAVFIVGKPSEEWDSAWLESALGEINETKIKAIASISTKYKREDMLFKAITEIRFIIQFLSSYEIGSLIYYDDVVRSQMYRLSYPKAIQANLLQSIMLRNEIKISNDFDSLIDWIKDHNFPVFFIKSIFFSIIDEIFEMKLGFNTPKFCQNLYTAMEYSQFSNVDEVLSKFNVIKDMVLLGINESNNKTVLLNSIIEYVYNNFDNSQFTISNAAEKFHISSSYLRRYFKEMTGKTMHEFIDEIRMEKAVNLLKQPDIQLKDISDEIGYYNYSSFIRKFKELYDCTPGVYRKNYLLSLDSAER